MLRLYLDDSGTDDEAPVVTIGGYLASEPGWARFEADAAAILSKAGIYCLHAADFQRSKGEFKGWDGPAKAALTTSLYERLAEIRAIGMSFSALKQDYTTRKLELNVNHRVSAYGFCFTALINRIARRDVGRGALEQYGCAVFVERGNANEGDLLRIYAELGEKYGDRFTSLFRSLTFVDKHSCCAVQMADFQCLQVAEPLRDRRTAVSRRAAQV